MKVSNILTYYGLIFVPMALIVLSVKFEYVNSNMFVFLLSSIILKNEGEEYIEVRQFYLNKNTWLS